ncbi:Amino acid permease [Actinidia chinensis var. chinensis]|uniref:Amino acid permease n=1 Tax=Actinidia chinensis var. chinensis TaxID=1590841 RepID=A0A2R6PTN9_ACTCC|nr:Amino acid permease [Actinidia chinensis var. chinensis]
MGCFSSNWRRRLCVHLQRNTLGDRGHPEVATTGKSDHVEGLYSGCFYHHHPLPLLWVFRIRCLYQTPGNLLTGFRFYKPYWLIDFANACIVIHLVGGYQIFSQPVFAAAERLIAKKLPNNGFVNNTYSIKLPMLLVLELNLLRLCFRTAYVASTTGIALLFPYFNQVLGVLGAHNFWPLAIYCPVEMYIVQRKIRAWSRMWVVLQSFKAVCLLVTIMAFVGSVEGLVSSNSKLN